MISIFRGRTLLGLNASVVSGSRPILRLTPPRSYSLSSYGGENQNISGKSSDPNSRQTKEREHPGPPPPNVSEASPSSGSQARPPPSSAESDSQPASSEPGSSQGHPTSQHPTSHIPSNEAHPTLTDGRASPYVDDNGNLQENVPEDVKEHNAGVADRYDRSYNQISEEGTVERGFWSKWKRN